jgi:GDP-4-dehydro-6-deoxy-D-mannose reductase
MKRVLITGITGMAGSHLADYLLKNHPEIDVVGTKRYRSQRQNIAQIESKVELVDCDFMDASSTRKLIKDTRPDVIFHLAALSFVPDSWKAPATYLHTNTLMQLNIFEAVRECAIDPVIQVALSSEQYGKVDPADLPLTEESPIKPISPYAVSKVTQDMMAYQYFQSYGLKVVRTRTFNHEGPRRGEQFVTSNFAKQIAEIEMGLRPPVILVGNLEASRDWSDVRDVVRAYWLGVNHCVPGDVYVISSGTMRTVRSMLEMMLSMSTAKVEIVVDPDRLRPSDVMLLQGDSSKFRAATGWEPMYSFEQTVQDSLDYWRAATKIHSNILGST